ncbi:MAG: S8 family peptidase, partial [Dehalococcoidia bacterium]|nr:S8 family peptidase [Dehalococcoidia bacterium]
MNEIAKDAWKPKISDELWKVMEEKSDNDLIPIWLWLQSVDQKIIIDALIVEKGVDPTFFNDTVRFEKEILAPIIKQIEEELGYEEAHRKGEDGMSPVDWARSNKVDEYRMAKIEIVMREYSAMNNNFVADNIGEKPRKVLYNSRSTPSIIVEATKGEIEDYAKQKVVVDISLYVEWPIVPCLNLSLTQVGADSSTGTKSPYFNSGYGYKGSNVTVGIIEPNNGQYNHNAPQLSGIHGTYLKLLDFNGVEIPTPTNPTDHATFVTSIIVGQAKMVGVTTYEGVVPFAKAYQMGVTGHTQFLNGIDTLVAKGCKVINYSAGIVLPLGYSSDDRDVDAKIANLGVTFVVGAGNYSPSTPNDPGNPYNYVMSPGKALNVISVGNADTKSNPTTEQMVPYNMNTGSSYVQTSALPNKPDISAPGTNISFVRSSGTVMTDTGTSFAAPLV